MNVYGGMNKTISYLGMAIMVTFFALFTGAAGYLISKALKWNKHPFVFLIIPFIWETKNLVLEYIISGFPWCYEGYSQYKNTYFAQLAELGGVYLVSFLVITVNVLLYLVLFRREDGFPNKKYLTALGVLLATIYTTGFFLYRNDQQHRANLPIHRAGILQPNTRNEVVLSFDEKEEKMLELLEDSRQMAADGAEFVVWPEFSVSLYPMQNKLHYRWLDTYANEVGPILGGFTDYRGMKEVFNTVFLFDKGRVQKYDKVHLTPFGEYILFKDVFTFVNKITDEIGETSPGTSIHNLTIDGHKIAPPICFELIFPQLVRQFIHKGAELIVITSNDAWYGDTSAVYQLAMMTVFRGIESRRYVIRSTTNGISALIDPTGKVLYQSKFDEKATFVSEFKYVSRQTLFTRFGYLFPFFCALVTILFSIMLFIFLRKRKTKSP